MVDIEKSDNQEVVTESIFRSKYLPDEPSYLYQTINTYLDLKLGVKFNKEENTLKRYEVVIPEHIKKPLCDSILTKIREGYANGEGSVEELVERETNILLEEIEKIKDKARPMEIEPFYGDTKFIKYRINYIAKCIERMLKHPRFAEKQEVLQGLMSMRQIAAEIEDVTLNTDDLEEQKINYEKIENAYKRAIEIEEDLSKEVGQLWNDEMARKNATEGEMAYWVHVLTDGEFNPEDMDKVCITYVTEKTLAVQFGEYGFVYPMDMKNIVQLSFSDAGSWKIDKEEFISRGMLTSGQFAEPIDEKGTRMRFEYPPQISKLLLPEDVERKTIENTIRENGEMLNYDNGIPYNEGVLINKDKSVLPTGVFVCTFANQDYTEKYRKAAALSAKLKLPLIELDKTALRERLGLDPLTPKEIKRLFGPEAYYEAQESSYKEESPEEPEDEEDYEEDEEK